MNKEDNSFITKQFVIKEFNEAEHMFTGYLSTYENEDRTGDIIKTGAFKESIKLKEKVPMLKNHDRNTVIGHMILSDTKEGVFAKGIFNMEIDEAKRVYSLIKHGDIDSMSVGMFLQEYSEIDPKSWFSPLIIEKAEITEGSIVTVPANPEAQIMEIKTDDKNNKAKKDKKNELANIKEKAEKIYKEIMEEK